MTGALSFLRSARWSVVPTMFIVTARALDHEELEDDVETVARLGRLRQRVEEMPPRVRHTASALAAVDVGDDVVARVPIDGERALCSSEHVLRGIAAARWTEDVDRAELRQERPDEDAPGLRLHPKARLVGLDVGIVSYLVVRALPEREEDARPRATRCR
jgi:hypothetical protein